MNIRELQLIELEILKTILDIFAKNNLTYFILGGTLLGAIRHKGFIPWDDDIDIGLPRNDYERFLEIAQNNFPPYFRLKTFKDNKEYKNYETRVEDLRYEIKRDDAEKIITTYIWIDIFPLDGIPGTIVKKQWHMFRLLFGRLLLQYSKIDHGINIKKKRGMFEKILILFGKKLTKVIKFDSKRRLYHIDKLLKKYTYEHSYYLVNFMGAYTFKEMFPKEYYKKGVKYEFEGFELNGPVEYDKVLKQLYGEYMKPLPPQDRISHSVIFDEKLDI
jgi:lipopolysaccharide cholinephosphotransferase